MFLAVASVVAVDALPSSAATIVPAVPLNTSLEFVASGINVNLPVLSSKPKKPTLAEDPSCQRNSMPLSLLSSDPGAVSPPIVNTGSSTVVVVLFTVVVVPLTVRLPETVRLPLASKNTALLEGYVIKMSLVPADKSTALLELELAITVVRLRVLPVFHVPSPTSHSFTPEEVCAMA